MHRLQEEQEQEKNEEEVILGDMDRLVQKLGFQAVEIGQELDIHNQIIDQTTDQVADTQDKMDITNGRLNKLNQKLSECCGFGSLKNQICALVILLFIIIILLLLLSM